MPGFERHWNKRPRPYPVHPGCHLAVVFAALCCLGAGLAGDEREQRVSERIMADLEQNPSLLRHGQPQWLKTAAGHEFLGLYQPAYGRLPRRAVLLVHGMGGHADWPEVIAPLRRQLPQSGWSTLSIQMPLLSARAPVEDYGGTLPAARRRIAAAVNFLETRNYDVIVAAGYSFGAAQVLDAVRQPLPVDGVITISPLAREFLQPRFDLGKHYAELSLPVLDVYGTEDYPEVRDSATERQSAADAAGNSDYMQAALVDADHYYTGQQNRLAAQLVAWLQRLPVLQSEPETVAAEQQTQNQAGH